MSEDWGGSESPNSFNRNKPVYSQSFSRSNNRFNRRDDQGNNFSSDQRRDNQSYQRNDRPKRNYPASSSQSEDNDAVTMTVDSRKLGLIIGRGGANIKRMEGDSGARIFVSKDRGGEFTNINIEGDSDNKSKARDMINECVQSDTRNFSNNNERSDWSQPRSRGSERRNFDDRRNDDRRNFQHSNNRDYNDSNNFSNNSNNYSSGSNNYSSGFAPERSYNDDNQGNSQYNNQTNSTSTSTAQESDFKPIDWQAMYDESEKMAQAKLAALPPIVKNLYEEDPEVARMSQEEVEEFRMRNMEIKVERIFAETDDSKKPIPNPVRTFEQAFKPYPDILKTIAEQNFTTPSPIQCQAWPVILSGEDMIGIAQTGTGKTLAFLLPALIHIESQSTPRNERVGPTVLILSPTRELALQIEKEINKYSYHGIKCVCVYGGGGNRRDQCQFLSKKPEIVVATPGRLEDFISTDQILLESVTYVVLDEADKMLEMGFECQIRRVLLKVRSDRQSLMTSATWPNSVRRLAMQYSNNPIQVVVGSLDLTAVHSVTQRIEIIDEDTKRERLTEFIAQMEPDDKIIVFCGKKSVTDDIASDLVLHGVKCQSLHGDREQCDREQALHELKTGEVRILIATDVAARGIDIADLTHIFNYDFPKNIEEYVHRIGRTGRAGKSGESVSLFTRRDWANAADLIRILEEANQGVPDELRQMAERFEAAQKRNNGAPRGGGRGGRGGRGFGGGFGGGGGGFGGGRSRY